MDVRKLVLLVGALVIAGITAVMAKNMFSGATAPQAQAVPAAPAGPQVLVATRSLPVGTILDPESVRFQPWPEKLVQSAYFVRGQAGTDPGELLGTVVRSEITAGQPVTHGALVRPGERGFLAAALGPGMRAITVPVTATSGVAGFVFPGDRVDIVLTQEVAGGGDGSPLKASETIIRNIRVLATDQRTSARDEEGKQIPQRISTVTFEATPKIAEKIAVAQTLGELSLSLRSIADNTAELERAIASGEIDVPDNDDPRAERRMLLAVANRPNDTNATYTVGGEVSRFQRSTVPGRARNDGGFTEAVGHTNGVATASAAPVPVQPTGPVVRVARGNAVTVVPVGAK